MPWSSGDSLSPSNLNRKSGLAYNVKEYGATGGGTTSDSASILAAASALTIAGGGTLYFPPGNYLVDSTVTILNNASTTTGILKITGVRGASRILPTVAPALSIGASTYPGNLIGLSVDGLTFQLTKDLYWAKGILRLGRCTEFDIANVDLLGGAYSSLNQYSGVLLELDTSYNGLIRSVVNRGRYTALAELNSSVYSGEQQDSVNFLRCMSVGACPTIVRYTAGNYNNLVWDSHKFVSAVAADNSQDDTTTLDGSHTTSVSALTCAAASSFDTNDPILIGTGETLEINKVTGISGTVLSLATATRFLHGSGSSVLHGPVAIALSSNNIGTTIRGGHLEFCAVGLLVDSVRQLSVQDVYSSVRDVVRVTGGPVQNITMLPQSPMGTSGVTNLVHVLAAADGATNTRFMFYGPYYTTSGSAYSAFVNDAGTERLVRFVQRSNDAGGNSWWDEARYPTGSTHTHDSSFLSGTLKYKLSANGVMSIDSIQPASVATVSLCSALEVRGPGRSDGVLLQHTGTGNVEVRSVGVGALTLASSGGIVNLSSGTGATAEVRLRSGDPLATRLTVRSGGTLHATNALYIPAGTSGDPGVGFVSELSLGLYRSAASTMALSYGNLALPNAASFASQTGSLPSATSAQGYLYTDSTSSLYWVNGSGVSTLVV